jgi:amidophosphoribosyltransferase
MCGIFGIIGGEPIAEFILQGLQLLQHRGQDAAGLFTYNPKTSHEFLFKDNGLVHQVFSSDNFYLPKAPWGIGHIRYSTVGEGGIEDIQPHVIKKGNVTIGMVHNGNIVNYLQLKNELKANQIFLNTTCDTEIILNIFANKIPDEGVTFDAICDAVSEVYQHVFGSYSILVLITGVGLVAFRDPWGFRPLLYGRSRDLKSFVFTSETGPISYVDADNMIDVTPGEVIFIDQNLSLHKKYIKIKSHTHCSFEFNYFAKPNAVIENKEVYEVRSLLGTALAHQIKSLNLDIDVVVPIPSTGMPSALSLGYALNIPIKEGFLKQNHSGRTFILPTQKSRKKAISDKLTTVTSVFENKNVLLVDDSIVRGNVSRYAVQIARMAGANKVYFASTFPPVLYPCFYGIDFPRQEELVAWGKTQEEVSEEIGADLVIYNSIEVLKNSIGITDLCTACLTGDYPTKIEGVSELQNMRLENLNNMELTCKS